MQKYKKIIKGNALFLDRDGVINVRIDGGYVRRPEELVFLPGAITAIARLTKHYRHIFVVTNQQGIGKGLMTASELDEVHRKLTDAVAAAGGHIEQIYYCGSRAEAHDFRRKPNIGMALLARKAYPDINLKESVMVGDAVTDMMFGRRCGMQTVLVGEWGEIAQQQPHLVDFRFDTLADFANAVDATD
ncbi:MAG: HAD family hydrolase [Bacteroidales bacterium]|nr:HAD family hydrolase [Bacteroidales bacterium]